MMDYGPLKSDEIRLIHLLPSADHEADIHCNLSRQVLTHPHRCAYSALSYVWGSPTPTRRISIDEAPVYVTTNLFGALRHIRHTTKIIKIWVDALCINQDDNLEKNLQVRRMGDIYAGAEPVYMWLGEEEDDSRYAMELLQRIETLARAENGFIRELKATLESDTFTPYWSALEKLFKRPYWTRVWIVQEVVCASSGIVCCGKHRAGWLPLMLFLNNSKRWKLGRFSQGAKAIWGRGISLQMQLVTMHTKVTSGTAKMSLVHGLVFLRNRSATDPRDYIYGAQNLVTNNGLEPDYEKPVSKLYRDVVSFAINQDESLDILSACQSFDIRRRMNTIRLVTNFNQSVEALASYLGTSSIPKTNNSPDESTSFPRDVNIPSDYLQAYNLAARDLCSFLENLPWMPEALTLTSNPWDYSESCGGINNGSSIPDWTLKKIIGPQASGLQAQDDDLQTPGTSAHAGLGLRNGNLGIQVLMRDVMRLSSTASSFNGLHLPSWAPDWRDRGFHNGILFNNIENCYYAASRAAKPVVKFSEDKKVMALEGVFIDSIEAVPPFNDPGADNMPRRPTFGEEWEMWTRGKQPRDIYGDVRQQQDAYIHTIVAGINRDGSKGACGLTVKNANLALDVGFVIQDEVEDSYKDLTTDHPLKQAGFSTFLLYYASAFCVTKQGFMSLAHRETQAGDIIVIFAGAKVPHLLRKYEDDDRYFLFGECYIHGLMEGEAFEELEQGKRKLETFALM